MVVAGNDPNPTAGRDIRTDGLTSSSHTPHCHHGQVGRAGLGFWWCLLGRLWCVCVCMEWERRGVREWGRSFTWLDGSPSSSLLLLLPPPSPPSPFSLSLKPEVVSVSGEWWEIYDDGWAWLNASLIGWNWPIIPRLNLGKWFLFFFLFGDSSSPSPHNNVYHSTHHHWSAFMWE